MILAAAFEIALRPKLVSLVNQQKLAHNETESKKNFEFSHLEKALTTKSAKKMLEMKEIKFQITPRSFR